MATTWEHLGKASQQLVPVAVATRSSGAPVADGHPLSYPQAYSLGVHQATIIFYRLRILLQQSCFSGALELGLL
jgi:hypothetical protein